MIRFLNSCQNSGVLHIYNQERHVPAMQCKFLRERIVATLKEHMASPSFTLSGGRHEVATTAPSSRSTPTNSTAVTSLTTRPAGSNTRCRFRSSSGGTSGGSGAQRSSTAGRSPCDCNVRAIEASTETPSFDDDSSIEPTDDFIVAKLNGECLGGCNVDHPPWECPNVVGDVAQQKKTFASLSSKQRSLPIRAIAATNDVDDDVDLINLHDPEDPDSDADQDFPQGRLCVLLVVPALVAIGVTVLSAETRLKPSWDCLTQHHRGRLLQCQLVQTKFLWHQ